MDSSADVVWQWLIHARKWPEYYSNSSNVQYENESGPILKSDTVFRWKTFDVSLISEVKEYVENERIAWTGKGFGLDVYHAWLIMPNGKGGCIVRTEEVQHGFVSRLGKLFFPSRMHAQHQHWLEQLAIQSKTGKPT
ncbi:unnamed protein product [Didymodactylos carnosus]|uniref:Uncharacterized protein n=1 Tax=Didymodactylos carnosus TaxID=1234261 RepID=A0A814YUK7_9BILA|nr:unnamed protein product [Didymodactylos carnosus]CAF1235126.1 unnamed protein product [Didymodactylos carnosus]CAF3852330.1 unnamed protein product [Didymodactylos carnosus]CAF3997573.1 unnamed protein product [Didymodactylos carnosus]